MAPFCELRPLLARGDVPAPVVAPNGGRRQPRSRLAHRDWRSAFTEAARERGVATASGLPLQFVAADDAGATAYEAHIATTGRVPSRDNAHDLFNAMVWLAFPQTKAALNARQAEEIARDGVRDRRGPVRDAATLIDESGLLLAAEHETCAALARLDWRWLFGPHRARWGTLWRPFAFGHALIEKLLAPYKRLTAAVVCLPLAGASQRQVDEAAARWLRETPLSPPQLSHLPVLGIPGWWPANEAPEFYADASVFRPAHRCPEPRRAGAEGVAFNGGTP